MTYKGKGIPDRSTPPSHYNGRDGLQPWDIWKAFDLDPWGANAVKYLCRAGRKATETKLSDLLKARNYINEMIRQEELRLASLPPDPDALLLGAPEQQRQVPVIVPRDPQDPAADQAPDRGKTS